MRTSHISGQTQTNRRLRSAVIPLNIPNVLTLLRIVLIPLFVGIFYFEKSWVSLPDQNVVATVIFTLAAVTDWRRRERARRR